MEMVKQSATQIDNFRRCKRYWAWDKIVKVPRPAAQSLQLGSRVHDILESFYQGGKIDLDETWRFAKGTPLFFPGKIAAGMLSGAIPKKYLKQLEAEMSFSDFKVGKAWDCEYTGKIDIHWLDGTKLFLVDHKTSSEPSLWGKKVEDLYHDTQAILYPRVGLEMYPETARCSFALNYGSTKANLKKNYFITLESTRDEILERFETLIEPASREMAALFRLQTNPLDLEPTIEACSMFGGCPYKQRCKLTSHQKLGAFMKKDGLLSKLMAQKGNPMNPPDTVDDIERVDTNPINATEAPQAEKEEPKKSAKANLAALLKKNKTTKTPENTAPAPTSVPEASVPTLEAETSLPKSEPRTPMPAVKTPKKESCACAKSKAVDGSVTLTIGELIVINQLFTMLLCQPLDAEVRKLAEQLLKNLASSDNVDVKKALWWHFG